MEHCPVLGSQIPASWQPSKGVQILETPTQTPAIHWSAEVQKLPSSQLVPAVLAGYEQSPVRAEQLPVSWHWSFWSQILGVPPQISLLQVSFKVQSWKSSHLAPSPLYGFEQVPVCVSQTPAVWQLSLAWHTTGLNPLHSPSMHKSSCVQAFPSSQVLPLRGRVSHAPLFKTLQKAGPWHCLVEVQTLGVPWQKPVPVHLSARVQGSRSSQDVVGGAVLLLQRPVPESQVEVKKQAFWGVQTLG